MKELTLTIPKVALLAVTRGALGVGIGLLLSGRLNKHQRNNLGRALFAIGALSTIPIAISIARGQMAKRTNGHQVSPPAPANRERDPMMAH